MHATATTSLKRPTSMRRALLAGVAGNMMEWFDYALYGFFASVISANFFPERTPSSPSCSPFLSSGWVLAPVRLAAFCSVITGTG